MSEPLVSIVCAVYNHEPYIRQCLDGFVMQKTTFPFEVLIHDDASTDGSAGIIREYEAEYPGLFLPVYQNENQYSKGVDICLEVLLPQAHGKYIAICEGDDFWTDPLKLQKQVDFMENHPDCSLCFHKVYVLCDESEKWIFSNLQPGYYSARQIYDDWLVPTCSVLYRRDVKPAPEIVPEVVFSDIFLWLQLAEKGKLFCMDFVGATYRRHPDSFSCGYSSDTCVRLFYQYRFFEKRFPDLKDISRRKEEQQGLKGIIRAQYFPGIWKYRFYYMFRHPELFFSTFFTTTILSYTPVRKLKGWRKRLKKS